MALHLGPAGDLRARLAKEKNKRKSAFPGAAEPFDGRKPPRAKKRKSGSSHNSSHPSPKRKRR